MAGAARPESATPFQTIIPVSHEGASPSRDWVVRRAEKLLLQRSGEYMHIHSGRTLQKAVRAPIDLCLLSTMAAAA